MPDSLEVPQSRCLAGVAVRDVTPPVGIYHRMWGAATHDRSTGVHRPLLATALVVSPLGSRDAARDGMLFVGLDHCLLGKREMEELLQRVSAGTGFAPERIIVFFSHTHGAGLMGYERRDLPGGELIPAYLEQVAARIAESANEALGRLRPADVLFTYGYCMLAQNRDYYDAENDVSLCGFNPRGIADNRLLVGRFTDAETGRMLLSLVNYACHPTTLAWDNTLISPDYIGAMREVIEGATGAPCLFIQGASGDLGPREGFVGDVAVADRNGRQLGHAALSSLEDLPPPGKRYAFTGRVISGATIGTWAYLDVGEDRRKEVTIWKEAAATIDLKYRRDLPRKDQLIEERAKWTAVENAALQAGDERQARDARAMIERATRRLARVEHLPPGESYPFELRAWRMGDALWIALNGEHYNLLQRMLRERYPFVPLVIGTLANGSNVWYLPDRESYGRGLYQEEASILARGSLEQVIDALDRQIDSLLS